MTMRFMRRWPVLCLVTVLLGVGVQPAAARLGPVERGIVQSLSATRLTLRSLDGSAVAVTLDSRTRFRLNGQPATIGDLRPGQVAEAVLVRGAARVVRAFGSRAATVELGVVSAVSGSSVAVAGTSGSAVTIPITPLTRVRVGIVPVRRSALRVGQVVRVKRAADGSAQVIVIRSGPR